MGSDREYQELEDLCYLDRSNGSHRGHWGALECFWAENAITQGITLPTNSSWVEAGKDREKDMGWIQQHDTQSRGDLGCWATELGFVIAEKDGKKWRASMWSQRVMPSTITPYCYVAILEGQRTWSLPFSFAMVPLQNCTVWRSMEEGKTICWSSYITFHCFPISSGRW